MATTDDLVSSFLDELHAVTCVSEGTFTADTPVGDILTPSVVDPEVLVITIAIATDQAPERVDQSLIHPETDTVATMMARFAGST